ncbi:MAG: hypothetical protein FWG98_05595 [Candidatus Cloacimonetes bacterium]|nr:hypothetical protein [Candidatus Cloacimonadota bacterium]
MFKKLKNLFDNNNIFELLKHDESILWLKLRAISRKDLLLKFIDLNDIKINSKKSSEIFEELFNIVKEHALIDDFIKANLIKLTLEQEQNLVSELYKIKHFDWGGDYKNALDRHIVDKYIKKYDSYDTIQRKLDNEINQAVRGYVNCSWYNHWSTILIENIFKQHKNVLFAIGDVKQIDFFIQDIPFDLKTTYLPVNFIDKERKRQGLSSELSEYKKIAKEFEIVFNDNNAIYEIREKGINLKNIECSKRINKIDDFKRNLLRECINNPHRLIQNLYEEQGEIRFDASNRLFLILVDTNDFDNSWKLKRDITLLKNNVFYYLDNFSKDKIIANPIQFSYKYRNSETFNVYSDCIFIYK